MKKAVPTIIILLGFAVLIWAYVDCYQLNLAELSVPGTMYCGFLPFGVAYDLTWREQYAWVRILCPILIFGGILLRVVLKINRKENSDEA